MLKNLTKKACEAARPAKGREHGEVYRDIQDAGFDLPEVFCSLILRVGKERSGGRPPRKSWVLYYKAPNRRKTYKVFGHFPAVSLADARAEAMKAAGAIAAGLAPFSSQARRAAEGFRFGDLAEEYFEFCREPDDHGVPRLRTHLARQRIFEKELPAAWWDLDARTLQREDVLDFLADVAEPPRSRPSIANQLKSQLASMYRFWIRRRYCSFSPIDGIPSYYTAKRRSIFFADDAVRRLWRFLEVEKQSTLGLAIVATGYQLGLLTGLRRFELFLTRDQEWESHAEGWLSIPKIRTFDGEYIGGTKQRRDHHVYLGSELGQEVIEAVGQLRRRVRDEWGIVSGFWFPRRSGRFWPKSHNPQQWKDCLRYRKATDIPDLGWHALRHTLATRATMLGFELSVSAALGHNSPQDPRIAAVTARYQHADLHAPAQMAAVEPLFTAYHDHLHTLFRSAP